MARETTIYVDGSAARRIVNSQAAPERRREYEPRRRRAPKPIIRRNVDMVSVVAVAVLLVLIFVAVTSVIHLKTNETFKAESVAKLQTEVIELEKENSNARQDLEDSLDLGKVYKKATKTLGMKSAQSSQIMTYESKKSTQVRVHKK